MTALDRKTVVLLSFKYPQYTLTPHLICGRVYHVALTHMSRIRLLHPLYRLAFDIGASACCALDIFSVLLAATSVLYILLYTHG
jgi:hypothetical protein